MCPITPVMEGNEFFLEIDIPAAQEPLGLHGVYWLYEDGVNTRQTYESISRSWRDEATTPWELKTLPYVEDEDLSGEALVAIAGIPLSNIDETSGSLTDTVKSRLDHLGLTHPRTGKVNNAAATAIGERSELPGFDITTDGALIEQARVALLDAMDDEEGELRAACIWTLGHFPVDKQTTEACIEALDDDYEWVVRYAIEALAHFGDLGALEPLLELSESEDDEIRDLACQAVDLLRADA